MNRVTRASVHARLGPLPVTSPHVAAADRRVNSSLAASSGPAPYKAPDPKGPEEPARPSPEATPAALMEALSPMHLMCSPAPQAPPLPEQPLPAASDLAFPPGLSSPSRAAAGPKGTLLDCDHAASGPEVPGLVGPCMETSIEAMAFALDAIVSCPTIVSVASVPDTLIAAAAHGPIEPAVTECLFVEDPGSVAKVVNPPAAAISAADEVSAWSPTLEPVRSCDTTPTMLSPVTVPLEASGWDCTRNTMWSVALKIKKESDACVGYYW